MQPYDFILAGGGVAGLSLAYHLVQSPFADARILIVDPVAKERDDRTLSFWTAQPTPYDAIATRTWYRLKVLGPDFYQEAGLQCYRYQTLRALDFYRFVGDALAAAPGRTRRQGHVTAIEDGKEQATVWVDERPYQARWVFDSRFRRAEVHLSERHICLWQHFRGWEVETEADAFDPETVTLMDFRIDSREEWRFCYVLPYTARRALVELVSQSGEQEEETLAAYLADVLGISTYRIVRREGGATPLTDYSFPRQLGQRVLSIGIKGGAIKPSTGYGFLRMQQDAAAIIHSLRTQGHPFEISAPRRLYHAYDRIMLHTLHQHRDWARPLFSSLFQHNPLERVLRFLGEAASPADIVCLTASLVPRAGRLVLSAMLPTSMSHAGPRRV